MEERVQGHGRCFPFRSADSRPVIRVDATPACVPTAGGWGPPHSFEGARTSCVKLISSCCSRLRNRGLAGPGPAQCLRCAGGPANASSRPRRGGAGRDGGISHDVPRPRDRRVRDVEHLVRGYVRSCGENRAGLRGTGEESSKQVTVASRCSESIQPGHRSPCPARRFTRT